MVQPFGDALPDMGDLLGKLPGPSRRFTHPKRHAGTLALGVFHSYLSPLNPADFPRGVSQEENISGHAFNREILVDRAHEGFIRFGDDIIVSVVGNGPAIGQGGDSGSPTASKQAVHPIPVQKRSGAAQSGSETLGQPVNHLVKPLPWQFPIGVRPPAKLE